MGSLEAVRGGVFVVVCVVIVSCAVVSVVLGEQYRSPWWMKMT